MEEMWIIKATDKRWRWIARDEDGELFLFERKPRKVEGKMWDVEDGEWIVFPFRERFEWVTFEGGPVKIERDGEDEKVATVQCDGVHIREVEG